MINQSEFILLLKITVLAFIVGAIALPSLILKWCEALFLDFQHSIDLG